MSGTNTSDSGAVAPGTALLTAIAMLAFAANSLLCRMALGAGLIDAASFASVRVVSGAVVLLLILLPRGRRRVTADWRAVATLFTYMVFFSFAYLSLSAASGALILFAFVQLTMFTLALAGGERLPAAGWAGLALAVAGLVYLLLPGLTAPDPLGAGLMAVAGIAWGLYSLLGRQASAPLAATANNFLYSVPLVVVVTLLFAGNLYLSVTGMLLAITSGALASGLGYVAWYTALRGLDGTRAATVQLSVPVIAAFGGVLLLSEPITPRLLLASAATLGGVWLVLRQRAATRRPATKQR